MTAIRPIRRAQLISPFGVGSIVDLPHDESLMVAGLDSWPFAREEVPRDWRVSEERLTKRLRVRELRLPPDFREGKGVENPGCRIPAVRFPRWHYCPRCGDMQQVPLQDPTRRRCRGNEGSACADRSPRRRPFVIPVRIVAVCPEGHIQDFPFEAWAHGGANTAHHHRLRYQALGSTASLSGILIRCLECDAKRTLRGSFEYDLEAGGALSRIGQYCEGNRPWLGPSDPVSNQECGGHLRVLQRGASNVYFPQTVSSIYLPLWAEGAKPEVIRILEDPLYWGMLTDGLIDGAAVDPVRAKRVAVHFRVDVNELLEAAQRRLDGDTVDSPEIVNEEDYRRAEYNAFIAGRGDENSDLFVQVVSGSKLRGSLDEFVSRVCLVRKLKETRAMTGFTRILPPSGIGDSRIQALSNSRVGWLPAQVVRGEGVFIELDNQRLDNWLGDSPRAVERAEGLERTHNAKRQERGQEPRRVGAKFLCLHTLAHALIKQLSFDCGYGSASLRERIYCESDPESDPMAGILIYTASGDSEGTLGGLVRQGEPGRLEPIFLEAIRAATWCSSDPVCIESPGQGTDNSNLAACHGCTLLSETSCEEGNRLLDRGVLVGTLRDPGLGLMASLVTDRAGVEQ